MIGRMHSFAWQAGILHWALIAATSLGYRTRLGYSSKDTLFTHLGSGDFIRRVMEYQALILRLALILGLAPGLNWDTSISYRL